MTPQIQDSATALTSNFLILESFSLTPHGKKKIFPNHYFRKYFVEHIFDNYKECDFIKCAYQTNTCLKSTIETLGKEVKIC